MYDDNENFRLDDNDDDFDSPSQNIVDIIESGFDSDDTGVDVTTELDINRLASGPLGGDQQIGSLIVSQDIDLIIFLRDPMTSQSHEPDIQALIRLCDVYHVPVATNLASAEIFIKALDRGELSWREVRKTETQRK